MNYSCGNLAASDAHTALCLQPELINVPEQRLRRHPAEDMVGRASTRGEQHALGTLRVPTQQVGSGQLGGRSELTQDLPRERVSTCREHSKETHNLLLLWSPRSLGENPANQQGNSMISGCVGTTEGLLGCGGALPGTQKMRRSYWMKTRGGESFGLREWCVQRP